MMLYKNKVPMQSINRENLWNSILSLHGFEHVRAGEVFRFPRAALPLYSANRKVDKIECFMCENDCLEFNYINYFRLFMPSVEGEQQFDYIKRNALPRPPFYDYDDLTQRIFFCDGCNNKVDLIVDVKER